MSCLVFACLVLGFVVLFLFYFVLFVNLTQERVIWQEEPQLRKASIKLPVGRPVGHFLN